MFQGQNLYRDTLQAIKSWTPTEEYGHERDFQNELQELLDTELNSGGGGMMGRQQDIPVEKEHGQSKADLAIDETVGIELKRDLSNSQTKKLRGQIETYLENYQYVIVCACGIKDKSGWRKLRQKYEGARGMEGGEVAFVWKKSENFGEDQNSRGNQRQEDDPLGGGLF